MPIDLNLYDLKYAVVNATALGANTVVSAVPGRKIKVLAYSLITNTAITVKWQSATTDISGPLSLAANGGTNVESALGLFETNIGEALNLNESGAVAATVGGHVTYVLA